MEKFIDLLLTILKKQQFLIGFLVLFISAYFLKTAYDSEIQAFPEFTNVQVKIITIFPGKAAEEVERFVTRPLEVVSNGLPGLIGSRSVSLFGLSAITLTFDDKTMSRQARLDTQQRIREADLPDGVQAELEPDASPLGEIYRYALKGSLPIDEIRMIQDWTVERELKSVPGVTDVVTFGGPIRTINVRLDPKKIWDLNLSVEEISENLSKNNLNAGGGFLIRGQEAYLVRAIGLYDSVKAIENAIVTSRGGSPIQVKDIGRVEVGNVPRLGQVGHDETDDVVEGIVLMRRGEDSLRTLNRVKAQIESLKKTLPEGVEIHKVYDRGELISRSSGTVIHNIVFGVGLVVLILALGFGLKNWSLILAVTLIIPISLLTAVFGVVKAGYSPNLISLGAVDFGIIVETAILAAETIIAGLAFEKARSDKFISKTLGKVFGPSLICALVLIVAFIPILSLQQIEGRIFRPLGITLVSAVIGGQIGALIFVPWFARWLPVGLKSNTWFHDGAHWLVERILNGIQRLSKFIPKPSWLLGSIFALIITFLFTSVGKEFLPDLNEGAIWIRARAPSTISLEQSVQIASEVRKRLKEIPEVTTIISQVGRPDDGTDSAGFDNIEFSVGLTAPDKWKTAKNLHGMIDAAQDKLKGIDGVIFGFSQYLKDNIDEAVSGVKGELAFKILGPDIYELQDKAYQIASILNDVRGSDDVIPQVITGQPEFRVKMDHQALASLGVDVAAASQLVESAIRGREAGQIIDSQNRITQIFVYPHMERYLTAPEMMTLPVSTTVGSHVTLDDVAQLDTVEGVGRIYRDRGQRSVAITTSVRGRDVVSFVKEASDKIAKEVQFKEGYTHRWDGSFQNASRAATQLMMVVPMCFLVILILLRSWFGQWSFAFYLLWEIPFSLIGGLISLKLMGLNLSISAASGGIVLCGVSFLTGMMILTDYENHGSPYEAIKNKSFGIVLSNAVAIFGLIPAALSTGVGAEISKPFAVIIVGGLVTSLMFSLTVYPLVLPTKKT